MATKTMEWRPGPTVCRCCLAEGCYKDISTEYFWMGKREVYAEMLSETFSVSIAYSTAGGPNSNSRLICEPCISRLRDASEFKRQVQECEKTFMQHLDPGSSSALGCDGNMVNIEPEDVKVEAVKVESRLSDDEFDDRVDFGDDDDDDLDDEPLTKFATKVPKKESVDILDLLDNSKAAEKRKSSTKIKATPAKKTKKEAPKPTSSKPKPEKKKKGPQREESKRRQGALTSIWELTLSERQNAAILLENTTARPFVYCRYFFKCFFCREQYSDIKLLLQHTLTHDVPDITAILKDLLPKGKRTVKVDISELKCRVCSKDFADLDAIRTHLVTEHEKPFTESRNGIVAYNLSTKDGQFSCHICDKVFQTFILLNRHMNVHFSNAVCETCGAGFMTHQRLIQHKEIHLPGGYPCNRCSKVYTTNSNLKYHIEKAHEGTTKMRMLRCPHCPERFAEHFRKLKHLKETHGITFTFECEVCKSVFPSRRALTMHTNKFHTQKTQCEICKKSFSCISTLKKHMICHTGERNFVCVLCHKAYRHQRSLRQHMRTHIEGNDYVKFTCTECGNGFPNRNEFNKHVREWHPRTYFN
ncbi:zinc finger protein 250-like isoform X15 [Galleria mellonella]|uniref:Zinc finger protein 250-like isoform X15 n=1 Tax=Galleria mellonella TaxID=7137 RepID=A0ABM3N196_GALME|nr:zinc finger protein 250-like isoform X15 [Galleria mellonella]